MVWKLFKTLALTTFAGAGILSAQNISGFSPASASAGGNAFVLTASGTGLTGVTTINWTDPGSNSISIPVNSGGNDTQFTVNIAAARIAASGVAVVQACTAIQQGCGGLASFPILPVVTGVTPASVNLNASNTPITVSGTFGPGDQIVFNGTVLPTTGNATQLQATVPAGQLTTLGPKTIQAVTAGNRTSPTSTALNVLPAISSLNPTTVPSGFASFPLTINVTGGFAGVPFTVAFNGTPVAAILTNLNQITATIPANLVFMAGVAQVTVSAAGATSAPASFQIGAPVVINVNPSTVQTGTSQTLTVTGGNYIPQSIVVFTLNGVSTNLATTYNNNQLILTAALPASLTGTEGTATITVLNGIGGSSSPSGVFLSIGSIPVVTGVTPNVLPYGSPATAITVSGIFSPGNSIVFNTLQLPTTGNATQLQATVPAAQFTVLGSKKVEAVNGGNVVSTVSSSLTVIPVITSLNPSGISRGSGQFGLAVNVTGGLTQAAPISVTFDGTNLSATYVSPTQATVQIPANLLLTQSSNVAVSITASGATSAPAAFTINGPLLSTVTPNSAPAGATTSLTLTGSNFVQGSVAVLTFNSVSTDLATSFVSGNSLTAVLPGAVIPSAGSATIAVRNAVGAPASNSLPFQVITGVPTLNSVTPTSATVGDPAMNVTLSGSGFKPDSGQLTGSRVLFTAPNNSTPVQLTPTFNNSTSLSLTIPATLLTAAGTATIAVINVSDNLTSGTVPYNIRLRPAITSISPNPIPAAVATTLTITGLNFANADIVYLVPPGCTGFPCQQLLVTAFNSTTSLSANVPANLIPVQGTYNVIVQNFLGAQSQPSPLTVGFSISSLNPATVTQNVSPVPSLVVLSSGGFTPNSMVLFNNQPLTTIYDSPTQVHATLLAANVSAAGTFQITVQNGSNVSNPLPFTVVPRGQLSGVTPPAGFAGTGPLTIQVTGTNFRNTDTVRFSGISLATTFVDAQTLSAVIPSVLLARAGGNSVTVVNSLGDSSNALSFQVTLHLTSLSPSQVNAGGAAFNLTAVLDGGVTEVTKLNYAGTLLNAISFTNTTVTVTVPATLIVNAGTPPVFAVDGTNQSNTLNHLVIGSLTLITLTPSFADAGTNGVQITLTGVGFDAGTFASVNGSSIPTTFVSPTQLTAQIPASSLVVVGTVQVRVTDSRERTSNALPFAILTPLSVTSLNPAFIEAGSGQFTLTVNGAGFDTTAVVVWKGTQLATTFVTTNQVTAIVPASLVAQAGTAAVGVTDARARLSNTLPFTINASFRLTNLNPSSAQVGTSVNMILTGSGFQSSLPGVSVVEVPTQVLFGSAAISATVVSDTQINVTIPANVNTISGIIPVAVKLPDGRVSNSLPFNTSSNPIISSITPPAVDVRVSGLTLTVDGLLFRTGAVIFVNGSSLPTTFVSSTRLTAPLPSFASSGTASVVVVNPDGLPSNTVLLAIGGARPVPPTLTLLSPPTIAPGGSGFTLTVFGTGFQTGAVINFGGTNIPANYLSSGQLNGVVPGSLIAQAGTVFVYVANPDGTFTNSLIFVITGKPTTISLTPPSISAGAPSFTLGVNGTSFNQGAVVTFGGTALTTTYISPTQLSASVPASLVKFAGVIPVIVINPDGISSDPVNFIVNPFSLTSFSPSSANVGGDAFTMTLTGIGFLNGASATFNGNGITTTFVSSTTLTANVAASQLMTAGPVQVAVTNPDGAVAGPLPFTIRTGITLTSISPTSVPAGSKNTTLGATGTGFVTGAVIQFNGSPIATTFISSTGLSGVIPAELLTQTGSFSVSVLNPNGDSSNSFSFTVTDALPLPVITTVSPNTALAGSVATTITVNGSGFVQGSVVQFGGTVSATTFVSATQLRAVVSAAQLSQGGSFTILVINPNGDQSNTVSFIVVTPLSITSLSPPAVSNTIGDSQLTIAGAGFVTGATVQFGSTTLPANVTSSTQLSVQIPGSLVAQSGQLNVTVTNPDNTVSNALVFTIVSLPGISINATLTAAGTNQVVLTLDSAAPVDLAGTLVLSFSPNASNTPANYADPAMQFAAGGTSINFTVTKGSKTAVLPGNGVFSPGSVAGTLTITLTRFLTGITNVLPAPPPFKSFTIDRGAPAITANTVRIINGTAAGFTVEVIGFTTTREISRATMTFTSTQSIDGGGTVSVDVTSAFNAYFSSATGLSNGGTFKLDIPFTISGADASVISAVSLTLTNAVGTSPAISGGR